MKEVKRTNKQIQRFIQLTGGCWKLQILYLLMAGNMRFGELRKALGGISAKVLTDALRDLEDDALISRTVYPEAVLRVEYSLTEKGSLLLPVLNSIVGGIQNLEDYEKNQLLQQESPLGNSETKLTFLRNQADYSQRLKRAQQIVADAEFILIGLGHGFNSEYFVDDFDPAVKQQWALDYDDIEHLEDAKNLNDIMNVFSYISPVNETDYWRLWSKIIWNNCYNSNFEYACKSLHNLVKDKEYFIVTTNPDTLLIRSGFPKEKFYYPLGSFQYLQCNIGCSRQLWPADEFILPIFQSLDAVRRLNSKVIPHCPHCGEYLVPNRYRTARVLINSKEGMTDSAGYEAFLEKVGNKKIALIEIGTSLQLPYAIRYRFENYVAVHPNASLLRFGGKDYGIKYKKSIPSTLFFSEDLDTVLSALGRYPFAVK